MIAALLTREWIDQYDSAVFIYSRIFHVYHVTFNHLTYLDDVDIPSSICESL